MDRREIEDRRLDLTEWLAEVHACYVGKMGRDEPWDRKVDALERAVEQRVLEAVRNRMSRRYTPDQAHLFMVSLRRDLEESE